MKAFLANGAVRALLTAIGAAALTALAFAWPPLSDVLKAGAWPDMAAWSAAGAAFIGAFVSACITAASMLFGDRFSGTFVK
jgi:hypothetical protein